MAFRTASVCDLAFRTGVVWAAFRTEGARIPMPNVVLYTVGLGTSYIAGSGIAAPAAGFSV